MALVKSNILVCFADKNPEWLAGDRFLVLVASEPTKRSWIHAEDSDSGKTIYGSEPVFAKQFG